MALLIIMFFHQLSFGMYVEKWLGPKCQGFSWSLASFHPRRTAWSYHRLTLLIQWFIAGFNPLFEGIKPNETKAGIVFVGVLRSAAVCEEYCSAVQLCTSYAYFDETTKDYANHCYVRVDGRWNTIKTSGVRSGKKVIRSILCVWDFHDNQEVSSWKL